MSFWSKLKSFFGAAAESQGSAVVEPPQSVNVSGVPYKVELPRADAPVKVETPPVTVAPTDTWPFDGGEAKVKKPRKPRAKKTKAE